VVASDPFQLAACFDLDGTLRAAASRRLLTADQQAALRNYGAQNAIRSLQRIWRPAGARFYQHPLFDLDHAKGSRGTLLVATDPRAVERRVGALSRYLWTAAAIGGGVALLAVLLLARALTRPLLAFVDDVRGSRRGCPRSIARPTGATRSACSRAPSTRWSSRCARAARS
jgi:hypothetical protein